MKSGNWNLNLAAAKKYKTGWALQQTVLLELWLPLIRANKTDADPRRDAAKIKMRADRHTIQARWLLRVSHIFRAMSTVLKVRSVWSQGVTCKTKTPDFGVAFCNRFWGRSHSDGSLIPTATPKIRWYGFHNHSQKCTVEWKNCWNVHAHLVCCVYFSERSGIYYGSLRP